ncbi:MAG TPA: hypothetical protein VG406_08275 [Isosphaeraceae bacterium]|jgi:hypothetical protein|nr:hypothetical protein [Isosphaeraceae bacterium]
MVSPRDEVRRRGGRRRRWAAVALVVALPAIGCQAEHAGMTLPSGKYMNDDVQYFPPGQEFRWSNTLAAQQRARMRMMGMDVPESPLPGLGGAVGPTAAPSGTVSPLQMEGLRGTDINASPMNEEGPVGGRPMGPGAPATVPPIPGPQ